MLKMALFDCAINENRLQRLRGICPLFSSPSRANRQLKSSPHPWEFAIQGKKKNANTRGSSYMITVLERIVWFSFRLHRLYHCSSPAKALLIGLASYSDLTLLKNFTSICNRYRLYVNRTPREIVWFFFSAPFGFKSWQILRQEKNSSSSMQNI